jgi:hypothetical protein
MPFLHLLPYRETSADSLIVTQQLDGPRLRVLEEQFDISVDRIKSELKERLQMKCDAAAALATAISNGTISNTISATSGNTSMAGDGTGNGSIPGVNIGSLRDEEAEEKQAQIARRVRERHEDDVATTATGTAKAHHYAVDGVTTPGGHFRTPSATYQPDDASLKPSPLEDMSGPASAANAALYDPLSPEPVMPSSLSTASSSSSSASSQV